MIVSTSPVSNINKNRVNVSDLKYIFKLDIFIFCDLFLLVFDIKERK